jgi:hypothetical protein
MLKKFLLGFAIAGGLIASAPAAVADQSCLLRHGCFFIDPAPGEHNGYWVCSDPQIYILCDG